jgi:hypothetical protein
MQSRMIGCPVEIDADFRVRAQCIEGVQIARQVLMREVLVQIAVTRPTDHDAAVHLIPRKALFEPAIAVHCSRDQMVEGQISFATAQLTDGGNILSYCNIPVYLRV